MAVQSKDKFQDTAPFSPVTVSVVPSHKSLEGSITNPTVPSCQTTHINSHRSLHKQDYFDTMVISQHWREQRSVKETVPHCSGAGCSGHTG